MISAETNEKLVRVGPGTPGGELLRRYWQPVGVTAQFPEAGSRRRVRILAEDLVLYRGNSGWALVEEHCPHRRASLYYGFIEGDDVRCAYHGWKFDPTGQCLEQPFERNPSFCRATRARAYPVEELAGMLFAYLGPPPVPVLPRWDVLARRDGRRKIRIEPVVECNWLQPMENAVDTVHTYWLHGHMLHQQGLRGGEYYYRPIEDYEFEQTEWGIVKRRTYRTADTGELEAEAGHPLVFPNMLRLPQGRWHAFHWRVPVDDTHTQVYFCGFMPQQDLRPEDIGEEVEVASSYRRADGEYDLTYFEAQDAMAWESQGAIYDRTRERLGVEDRGVAMYRRLLLENMDVVAAGKDPMALVRDPAAAEVVFHTSRGQARPQYVTPHTGPSPD